jgi:hypothetical protein
MTEMTVRNFVGHTHMSYLIIEQKGQFAPNNDDAVVLGVNVTRDYDRYVTWRAYLDGDGKRVYWAGAYFTDLRNAVTDLYEKR